MSSDAQPLLCLRTEGRDILRRLGTYVDESERRLADPETDRLRERADLAERRLAELEQDLRDARTAGSEAMDRVVSLSASMGAVQYRCDEAHLALEECRRDVAQRDRQLREMGVGTAKGMALERDVAEILRETLDWEFEIAAVGQSAAKAMDILLTERRPDNREPIRIRLECKHKKEIRTEDVDKFLRDLTDCDAAVFYTTAPITATQRARLASQKQVVVAEEPGTNVRASCVIGSVSRAMAVAMYRREVARQRLTFEARVPDSLQSMVRELKEAAAAAHAFADGVMAESTAVRKRMRQSIADATAQQAKFARECDLPAELVAPHPAFEAIAAQASSRGAKQTMKLDI
jgi:hypothetical protein